MLKTIREDDADNEDGRWKMPNVDGVIPVVSAFLMD